VPGVGHPPPSPNRHALGPGDAEGAVQLNGPHALKTGHDLPTVCLRIGALRVRVKSYRDVLAEYEVHPEPKSAALDRA